MNGVPRGRLSMIELKVMPTLTQLASAVLC